MSDADLRARFTRVLHEAIFISLPFSALSREEREDTFRQADAILPLVGEAVTAERERCARIAENAIRIAHDPREVRGFQQATRDIAAAIRTPEPTEEEK